MRADAVGGAVSAGASGTVAPALRRAAEEFEAVFVGQLLGGMLGGLSTGGQGGGDDPFAAMLRDEYARLIARRGGIGVADAVLRQLLRAQEAA
jgi:Rod binding domain-containing protein